MIKKIVEPINDTLENVVDSMIKTDLTPTQKNRNISNIGVDISDLPPTQKQGDLFHIEKQVEYNGIEMGVLENGLPYLTERGLAKMCGIDRKSLNAIAINWQQEKFKPRGKKINELLEQSNYYENNLFLKSENNGTEVNAYTEPVCLALLEYYAFLADEKREQAINAFRSLARTTFRSFIYQATGYSPNQQMLDSWKHFHDRIDMTIDAVPLGYFSIFREIASMIVPMIRSGVIVNDKVIPDISVGKVWSKFWQDANLSEKCGDRIRYNHEYPLYYPQAKSNPQPAFAYPDKALPVFRAWLREHYIINKFPNYLMNKAKKGDIEKEKATKTLEAFTPKQIK